MLCLTFSLGDQEYAINTKEIVELIPLVKIYSLPKTSVQFIGYINYRGNLIPVLDLAVFLGYLPAELLFSTRIIIVNFLQVDDSELLTGVLVQNVSEIEEFDDDKIKAPDISITRHPLLNKVIMDGKRVIYLISFRSLKTLQLES